MEDRHWGRPGFNFSRSSMNYSGGMSDGSMPYQRSMNRDFGMMSSSFPAYNRPVSYHDVDNDNNNHDLRGNAFWGSPAPFEPSPAAAWRGRQKKKMSTVLKQFPKQEGKFKKAKGNYSLYQKGNSQGQDSPDEDKSPEQPKPKDLSQTANSTAKNPQEPNASGANQPASSQVKQQNQTRTPNGDVKKPEAAGEARDADVTTPPHKKLKTQETKVPADDKSTAVNRSGMQADTNLMYTCNLCQYRSMDERETQRHFYSFLHREVLKHLYIFFPKQRVDFLHEYLMFKKKKLAMQQKNSSTQLVKDPLKGIGADHYLQRVQATHCQACDVLIPYVPELVTEHITLDTHRQNCKVLLKNAKVNSLAAAKALLMDSEVVRMLTKYNMKVNPFKEGAGCSLHGGAEEILVAEEDDDVIFDDDDDDDDDEDAIADAGDEKEVAVNHNEGPAPGNKDSDNKKFPPNEPEVIKPVTVTSSLTVPSVFEEEEEEEEEEAAEAP